MGQVSIQAAFDSPNTLSSATDFLRECSVDFAAQAAIVVVPKHRIAYPQVTYVLAPLYISCWCWLGSNSHDDES